MGRREFIVALAVSLLLHIFLMAAAALLPSSDSSETTALEVFLETPDGGWQIADIPRPAEEKKPDKARFLGMYSQKVDEETVASGRLAGSSEQGAGSNPPTPPLGKGGKGGFVFAMKSPVEWKDTAVSSSSPAGGLSQVPEDYYPDYKHGEHTYINVLRYPDVEYFVRLKRIFKTTWNPVPALRQDMQATSVSRGTVSVVLAVSVDGDGELAELFVLRSSGLENYDREALRTIRASSPFAGPPEKFLEDDDVLRMSWTFVVYM